MRVLSDRWDQSRLAGTGRARGIFSGHVLRTFVAAPAVVAAALDATHFLDIGLADVANPEVTGPAIEAPAPGIAEAQGVDLGTALRAEAVHAAELGARGVWVVGRNAIERVAGGTVDIDANHLAEQRRQALRIVVGRGVAVSNADVEKPVGAEHDAATVVMLIVLHDPEDDALGIGIECASAVVRGEFRDH
jgi:hypothetical protein